MSACRDVAEEPPRPVSPQLCPNVNDSESGSGRAEVTAEEVGQSRGEERGGVREEQAHEEEQGEGPRRPKAKRIPRQPTAEEIRIHKATHCPFRSWCPKCNAARGQRGGHPTSESPIDDVPMISLDYCFLRRGMMGSRVFQC